MQYFLHLPCHHDACVQQQSGSYAAYTTRVQASYLEIYCERVYDLLSEEQTDLQVRQHPEKGVRAAPSPSAHFGSESALRSCALWYMSNSILT